MKTWTVSPMLLAFASFLSGCGSQTPACGVESSVLAVSPVSATADHTEAAPRDQQQFQATSAPAAVPGCATPAHITLLTPAWTVSDTLHVKISSAADSTNGVATCLGPTTGPATVTAHVGSGTSQTLVTASLTCK